MRYLLIGLMIVSFLAGVASWELNRPVDEGKGWVRGVFNAMGLSQRDAAQKAYRKQVLEALDRQRELVADNLARQSQFLESAQYQQYAISNMVKELSDKTDADMLRLKSLISDLSDQNKLLIERGQQMMEFNQEQLRIRQQTMDDANYVSIDSNLHKDRFAQIARDSSEKREDFINKSMSNAQALREQAERMEDKLNNLENQLIKTEDKQTLVKIKDIQSKSKEMLSVIKINEQRIRDLKQQGEMKVKLQKEKTNDFISSYESKLEDARDRLADQKMLADELTRDRIQNLKEQRSR